MKNFDIQEQWKLYLQKMELDLGNMPMSQIRECFRAFLGGIMQLYMFIYGDLCEMTEKQAIQALENLEQEISSYFAKEMEYDKLHLAPPVFPEGVIKTDC